MNSYFLRQAGVTLSLIITIGMNILANTLPLNGQTTGEISDRFQVLFVPAGYVFSIWGIIYLGLMAYTVYQSRPAQRENARLRAIDWPFILSCGANIAWLVLWHYEQFVPTVLMMLILLACLIVIYLRLGIGQTPVSNQERWLVHAPFSLYLGWVTVATIANITTALEAVRWTGWGLAPEVWTVIMLAAGVGIAALMALTRRDVVYVLVLVWAYAGIAVKQAGVPLVASAALVTTVILTVAAAVSLWLARRAPSVTPSH